MLIRIKVIEDIGVLAFFMISNLVPNLAAYSEQIGHTFRLKPATIPSETRPDRSEATLRLSRL